MVPAYGQIFFGKLICCPGDLAKARCGMGQQ